jgi:hypothetical protein
MASGQNIVDQWTPLHVLSGIVMQRRGWSPATALLVTMGFGALEKEVLSKIVVSREKQTNMASDMMFNMTGYFTAKKLYEED